jgi:hypothetical protein
MQKSKEEFSWRLLPYAGLKVRSLNRLCAAALVEVTTAANQILARFLNANAN